MSVWNQKLLPLPAIVAIVIAIAVVPALSIPVRQGDSCRADFEIFKVAHGKEYLSEGEHEHRLHTFCNSLKEIQSINSRELSWKAGINEYSDLSADEFLQRFTMTTTQNCSATHSHPVSSFVSMDEPVPAEKDWRNETCGETSCVSMVKNQGNCGSCWTFSTVAALEALHAINTKTMVLLSEQQLVDCAQAFNNNGCNGGLPSQAFEYIKFSGGLSRMEDYPYVCGDGHCKPVGGKCQFNPKRQGRVGVHVSNVANFTPGDEESMRTVVGLHNPVSVAFEVVGDLRHYSTGVYASSECKGTADTVNHAVLAVGYGTEDATAFWEIKNSWGFGWGNNGYFRMQRNVDMCGVAVCSSFPLSPDRLVV